MLKHTALCHQWIKPRTSRESDALPLLQHTNFYYLGCDILFQSVCQRILNFNFYNISTLYAFTDEEIGGFLGMKLFIETEDFKNMNVGFALDEGTCRLVDKRIVVLYTSQ